MSRRPLARFWTLLGLPLALFSAMPSVQWCSGSWVPLTQEQFAACLASEFTGCTASVACSLPSCAEAVATRHDDSGTACESACAASDTEPSGDSRAFCVGNPAGGFGLKPVPEDDTRPDASFVAAAPADLTRPALDRGRPIASPSAGPGPAPRHPTAPIRGPPST